MKSFTLVTVIFLATIAALHIFRIVSGLSVIIGNWHVPAWVNALAAIITGGLALMLWKENLKTK